MIGGAGAWPVLAAAWLVLGACAPPCVDDGLHARQHGAGCAVSGTSSGAGSTGAATTGGTSTSSGTGTSAATTTTSDTGTSSGSGGLSSGSGTSTSSSSSSGDSSGGGGTTVGAHCFDDAISGDETGLDCGGSCGPCPDGQGCLVPADCGSQACNAKGVCVPPHCADDLYTPGKETYVDCGGECGATCGLGLPCAEDTDCLAGTCLKNRCVLDPHCADNELTPPVESDVDCGVECGASCRAGQLCGGDKDCISNMCAESCSPLPSCDDGKQDLGETGIDCGGPCFGCFPGGGCVVDADCSVQLSCIGNVCT